MHGHVDRCPHMGLPLAQLLDRYLAPDGGLVLCSWHGALSRIGDGTCIGGPCAGQRLADWPVAIQDERIITA